ncbi:MAG TPA: hypothetical protein VGK53_00485, partial [Propionicimonas sp.]
MVRLPRQHRYRAARVFAALMVAAVGLAACSNPDLVTTGERPNSPATASSAVPSDQTDPAKLALELTRLPGFIPATAERGGVFSRPLVDGSGKASWKVLDDNNQVVDNYRPSGPVAFGDSSVYTKIPGVLTFRGNNFRNAPVYGATDVSEKKLQVIWTHDTGDVRAEGSYWAGAGWTGQPLLVKWPAETKAAMNLDTTYVDDPNFVEVIYPVVDGNVYRIDLATGRDTKQPISTGFAFKG